MSEQQLANTNLGVERFRILVIGSANAGKTTILQKVCHAQGREPVYFDVKGNELEINAALQSSTSCGEHNIEHQFQYPTAHGFIFHDSRGFEAGGADELDKVKDFIKKRAESEQLKDQLHAIWYCITTSNDRGMTEAEMSLFESGAGNVPVIAIFTKMDALDAKARNKLVWEKVPFANINEQVPIRAKAIFEEKYLRRLQEVKHQPRHVVQLRDMHKEGTDCNELIVRTSQALNNHTLRLFCLSMLRNDEESRIKHVISHIIIPKAQEARESGSFSDEQAKSLFCDAMYCFPHVLPSFDKLINDMDQNAANATFESVDRRGDDDFFAAARVLRAVARDDRDRALVFFLFDRDRGVFHAPQANDNHLQQCFKIVLQSMPPQVCHQHQAVWIGLMAVAIADLCLFASHSASCVDFQEAFDFCLNVPSHPLLMSVMEKESSISDTDMVTMLDTLKGNRDHYKAQQ